MKGSEKRTTWISRYWWVMTAAFILLLSFAAMGSIWKSLKDIEKNRMQEHENLARNINETARNFIINKEYSYFMEFIKILTQSSFVEYIAVFLDGQKILQAGHVEALDAEWAANAEYRATNRRADHRTTHLYVNQGLDFQQGKKANIKIAFSLKEFQEAQKSILAAFGVSVLLLILLGVLGYILFKTHQRLLLAEKTKRDMIYSITHDAKQDLTVIQGKLPSLIRKIRQGADPDACERDLKNSLESAESLDRYLNNLKDQQGLSEGKMEIWCEPFDPAQMVRSVIEAFEEKAKKRSMGLIIKSLAQGETMYADQQVAKRVLMNIIHNALKYSPAGGTITLWQEEREGHIFTFVQDCGAGISKQNWERVFLPYVQLEPNSPGMGLGLATSRKMTELMGGVLDIAASSPQGTTFYFSLPKQAPVQAPKGE